MIDISFRDTLQSFLITNHFAALRQPDVKYLPKLTYTISDLILNMDSLSLRNQPEKESLRLLFIVRSF